MSVATEEFVDAVRAFCRWVEAEKHDCLSVRQFLLSLMQGLPRLACEEPSNDRSRDYPRRGYAGWKIDFERLSDLPFHHYRMVYSPLDIGDEESVVNDLRDDLADIYGDLAHGLTALDAGDSAYAFRHWRDSYFYHWGHHAAAAIRAVDEHYREVENGEQGAPPHGGLAIPSSNSGITERPPSVS